MTVYLICVACVLQDELRAIFGKEKRVIRSDDETLLDEVLSEQNPASNDLTAPPRNSAGGHAEF